MEVKVIFHSDDRAIKDKTIQCSTTEKISSIIERFVKEISSDVNNFEFYYLQTKIKEDSTIASLEKDLDSKDIIISYKKRSKIMRCPKCICNNAIIQIKDYKLNFYECCHGHKSLNEIFDNYNQTQIIPLENIRCHKCRDSQKNYIEDFGKCLTCSKEFAKYYCPKCWGEHPKSHKVINYDEKYYYCQKHHKEENNVYTSYCENCKKNLCEFCVSEENKEHKIEKFENMIIDIEPMKKDLNNMKDKIDELKLAVDEIKHEIDEAVKMFENYYNIAKDILEKYESFNTLLKNYQVLKTIKFLKISNKEVEKDLDIINGSDLNFEKKCFALISIYKRDREFYSNLNNNQNNFNNTLLQTISINNSKNDEDIEKPNTMVKAHSIKNNFP